jgi:hypothetical protein
MDVVWLVLDSLSASATPFVDEGPETMPNLSRLAAREGLVFTNAYVPGPSSPSSHGSFFTGKLPSETGMHEARPYFTRDDIETIAGALGDTHESLLISSNPFIFNGLQRDFDATDDLRNTQYLLFEDAADPGRDDERWDHDSTIRQLRSYLAHSDKPAKSLLNAISYKLWVRRQGASIPKHAALDSETYQYAETMVESIREFRAAGTDETFVVANFMDVHPPFDASDAALAAFAPDRSRDELPIGVRGQDVYEAVKAGDTALGERMYDLYQAAIWDLDRKVTPLVETLVDDGACVVITADHGTWFRRERELEEERIHVPLIVFTPDAEPRTVPETVNLRSLPRTTMEAVEGTDGGFAGPSLLDVVDDQTSITEFIHTGRRDGPVQPSGPGDDSLQRDIVAVEGDTRVDSIDGEFRVERGSDADTDALRAAIEDLLATPIDHEDGDISYDEETEARLRELGYLE